MEGEPRFMGYRVRRRAVWAAFCSSATLVLLCSCSADGVIRKYDGRLYLHYSQYIPSSGDYSQTNALHETPDQPARVGYRCTSGGGAAAEHAIGLTIFSAIFALAALLAGVSISCRGGCATASGGICVRPSSVAERWVYISHRFSAALMIVSINLWLPHAALLSAIRGACGKELSQANYMYGYGDQKSYAEKGFEINGGLRYVGYNGTAAGGVAGGALKAPGFYVAYSENTSLQTYAGRRHPHLYGGDIAAAFLGALALLLQIPGIILSQRCIEAKAARLGAAHDRAMEMHSQQMSSQFGGAHQPVYVMVDPRTGGAFQGQPQGMFAGGQGGQPYFYPQQQGLHPYAVPVVRQA